MEARSVVLYGQSMLISLVAANLAKNPNLRVLHAAIWEEVVARATECTPDVFIYDLSSASGSVILPLLFQNPQLLLIGLDVESNRAVLHTGQEAKSLTLERVKEMIEKGEQNDTFTS
jgi:hypothetical protein